MLCIYGSSKFFAHTTSLSNKTSQMKSLCALNARVDFRGTRIERGFTALIYSCQLQLNPTSCPPAARGPELQLSGAGLQLSVGRAAAVRQLCTAVRGRAAAVWDQSCSCGPRSPPWHSHYRLQHGAVLCQSLVTLAFSYVAACWPCQAEREAHSPAPECCVVRN